MGVVSYKVEKRVRWRDPVAGARSQLPIRFACGRSSKSGRGFLSIGNRKAILRRVWATLGVPTWAQIHPKVVSSFVDTRKAK